MDRASRPQILQSPNVIINPYRFAAAGGGGDWWLAGGAIDASNVIFALDLASGITDLTGNGVGFTAGGGQSGDAFDGVDDTVSANSVALGNYAASGQHSFFSQFATTTRSCNVFGNRNPADYKGSGIDIATDGRARMHYRVFGLTFSCTTDGAVDTGSAVCVTGYRNNSVIGVSQNKSTYVTISNANISPAYSAVVPLLVGNRSDVYGSSMFSGSIHKIAMFNVALSQAQSDALHDACAP